MNQTGPARSREQITERFVRTVCERLSENKPVRRTLPIWGRLHIDRQLPFLCVYRKPRADEDIGTAQLVTSEASYLIASGAGRLQAGLQTLVRSVAQTLSGAFGAFLIVELWSGPPLEVQDPPEAQDLRPRFRVVEPPGAEGPPLHQAFVRHLRRIRVARREAEVVVSRSTHWSPPRSRPLLTAAEARALNCSVIGLEVAPTYRNPAEGEVYPLVLRDLRRKLTRGLRRSFHDFVRSRTTQIPEHYHVLGRRALVKAVWEVDRQLAEVSDSFDLLLQLTPTNSGRAWRDFERSRFERQPVFEYRPLPIDPIVLKRRLYEGPIERIEDPALAEIFREKQDELDRRITMLLDIDTRRFIHGSLQLFGGVSESLQRAAERILERVPPRAREASDGGHLAAAAFAERAREEIDYYRSQYPELAARVQVRDDVLSGLMVSRGSLLVGAHSRIPAPRVEALLQHEVGTHVLTYYNGRAQGFRQLYSGLAGYEALQEGIAVLAEYLVGGLSRTRMRLLAGRVIAVRQLIDGASFVETFRALRGTYGFSASSAFSVTLRVHRGGGLTKDAVYLRGLRHVLDYLRDGGELEPLFVGKIAIRHVRIIRELRLRGVLREPPLRPRYLDRPGVSDTLERLRRGMTLDDLIGDTRTGRKRGGVKPSRGETG